MNPINFIANYSNLMKDVRLERRGEQLWNKLSLTPCSSIRRLSADSADQKAYYRFLNNDKVKETIFVEEAARRMKNLSISRHLLCIQDTCEINLGRHKGRHLPNSGLGRSDNSESADCFKVHPGLVVDAGKITPLGFSHIKIFHRPEKMPDRLQRRYKSQPIEEKESYKWIEVAQHSKEVLKQADSVTFIEDREGDIYEQFALIPDDKTHLLVRSRTTRNLIDGKAYIRKWSLQLLLAPTP